MALTNGIRRAKGLLALLAVLIILVRLLSPMFHKHVSSGSGSHPIHEVSCAACELEGTSATDPGTTIQTSAGTFSIVLPPVFPIGSSFGAQFDTVSLRGPPVV